MSIILFLFIKKILAPVAKHGHSTSLLLKGMEAVAINGGKDQEKGEEICFGGY